MTTPTLSAAARLVLDFVTSGEALSDRADLARFLREHRLATEGAIPITLSDLDEALTLRAAMRAVLIRGEGNTGDNPDVMARGQRVLDGLRVTVRLLPDADTASPLAPAVVDEVRRGLARIAGAWAALVATGELRDLRV
ncbi:ABATE domain-containing protein [Nocardiopsis sp. CNR-923]|uniref:ABATE domain-containing protein n=1 Tax=Nocardiopsis sp. CNR-923 TaxID=1904965 RepID=UPI00117C95D2|nr:ABATE domain-containing protein [Nocardiopsis sp. CNR-923]